MMTEMVGLLVVQEVVVVVLCILCILVTLVPTTIITSHFTSLPIIKRNLLTRQDQLLVSFSAFAICYQVGVRCQVSGLTSPMQCGSILLVVFCAPIPYHVALVFFVLTMFCGNMMLMIFIALSATRMLIILKVSILKTHRLVLAF